MIGDGPLGGFRVTARKITDIRASADSVRGVLGVDDEPQNVDFGWLLDHLTVTYGITYDVLESDEMPHSDVEACWDPESVTMYIRDDVFAKVCLGEPRAKFTVIHELGHGLLGHKRTINRTAHEREPEVFEDSEWQANQFAAEFLMPLALIRKQKLKTAAQLEAYFRVSSLAATKRVKQLQKRGELPC